MEWIQPDGEREIQINCGVRLVGGWSRHYRASPKKSLRLIFRSQFGPAKLNFPIFGEDEIDEFDKIQLRATFSDGWVDNAHPAQFLRDPFMRETYLAMGQPGSRSNFVHLYLNGLYWGIYNPSERPDGNYAASHFGGSESDYDALKHEGLRGPGQAATDSFEVIDGTSERWKKALSISGRDIKDSAVYAEFKEYVDVISLADYVLVNSFLANMDWPGKNWYAFGRRDGSDGGFKFSPWDSEYSLHNLNGNRVDISGSNTPARFYSRARSNPEFRLLFADRVHKHAFNGGSLTVESMVKRYTEMANHIEPAIDAEAARWGDNRHTRQGRRDYRKSNWLSTRNAVLNNFLKNRPPIAISQYRAAGLYPSVNAPEFNQHGGFLDDGNDLTLDTSSKGTIFYTLDGNDPRLFTSENDTITALIEDEAEKSVIFVANAADEPPVNWNALGFDHSGWLKGTLGAGYEKSGNGRYDPLIDELLDFESLATSSSQETIYMLTDFWVDDPSVFNLLTLKARYDDGFVAYLNGVEVVRENMGEAGTEVLPSDFAATNVEANIYRGLKPEKFFVENIAEYLLEGQNVLSIQVHNANENLADLTALPILSFYYTDPPLPNETSEVTIRIQTDSYPEETSWTLVGVNGTQFFETVSPGSMTLQHSLYEWTFDVPTGDYGITVTDTWGDGICCEDGVQVPVYNSGFESDGGWSVWPTDVSSENWNQAHGEGESSYNALEVFGSSSNGSVAFWQQVPVYPGELHHLSVYAKHNSENPIQNGQSAHAIIEFWGGGWWGQYLISSHVTEYVTASSVEDEWIKLSAAAVAPEDANNTHVVVVFSNPTGNQNGSVFFDNMTYRRNVHNENESLYNGGEFTVMVDNSTIIQGGEFEEYHSESFNTINLLSDLLDYQNPYLHTNFRIRSDGETVYLSNQVGEVVDSMNVPSLSSNVSYGYQTDGVGELTLFNDPTPEYSNSMSKACQRYCKKY